MPFREVPPTSPRSPAHGWKNRVAGAALGIFGTAQGLEACTFGPAAPRRYGQGGEQTEVEVRNKLREPRMEGLTQEFQQLPQASLERAVDAVRTSGDTALTHRLQLIERATIWARTYRTANVALNRDALSSAAQDMQNADAARQNVPTPSLVRYFAFVHQCATNDMPAADADALISLMAQNMRTLPQTLSRAATGHQDHLARIIDAAERLAIADYLVHRLGPSWQERDPAVAEAIIRAGRAFHESGDMPRPILVTLLQEALTNGPLFTSQDASSRIRPALRSALFVAGLIAQERDQGSTAFDEPAAETPATDTQAARRHHHRRHRSSR